MDSRKAFIIALVLDIVLLAVAGYFYTDAKSQGEVIASLTAERDASFSKVKSLEDEKRALKSRLELLAGNANDPDAAEKQRLLKAIDEKDSEINRLKALIASNNANADRQEGGRQDRNRGRRGNPDEMMARLKEENPERYEQIMNERERRRQEMQARVEKRDSYLSRLDTSKLNSEQRQTISEYQALLKANEELRASMQEGSEMANFRDVMRNQFAINNMSGAVRDILIEQFAGSNVAEEVKNIIDATSPNFGGGPGGFGGGPGGFGGGRGGFGGRGNR